MAQRIQIRDEICRLLSQINGIDHVVVGRFKPLEVSRCPFVRVLADSETGELYRKAALPVGQLLPIGAPHGAIELSGIRADCRRCAGSRNRCGRSPVRSGLSL